MAEQTFDYAKFITMLETHNWRYVLAPSGTGRSLGDMERLAIVNVLASKEVPYEARLLFHAYRKAYDPSYEPFDMPKEEADAV
jgi:hypothetical protein